MVDGMWTERDLRFLASTQHGLLHREQLLAREVSDYEIGWRAATGRIETLHPGVYYLDCTPATWRTEVLAAVFAAGPDALASHRTAGVLYGLDAVYGKVIEVTVPYAESPEPVGTIVHRTRRSNPVTVVDAIACTTIEKTLMDLGPIIGERNLYKATRSAIHIKLTTADKLDMSIGLFGGRGVSGTRLARRVFHDVRGDQSGSVSEVDLAWIIETAPIPAPIQQLRIRMYTTENAYPDFAWPDRMRIVEADGFGSHSTPAQQQSDLRRQNRLMELGWEMRRFTAWEIREEPDRIRDEIIRFVNRPFREDLLGHSPS